MMMKLKNCAVTFSLIFVLATASPVLGTQGEARGTLSAGEPAESPCKFVGVSGIELACKFKLVGSVIEPSDAGGSGDWIDVLLPFGFLEDLTGSGQGSAFAYVVQTTNASGTLPSDIVTTTNMNDELKKCLDACIDKAWDKIGWGGLLCLLAIVAVIILTGGGASLAAITACGGAAGWVLLDLYHCLNDCIKKHGKCPK